MHRKRHIYIARESFSKPILRLFPAPSHFSCKGALTSQIILTVIIFSPEYSIKQCRSMHKDKKNAPDGSEALVFLCLWDCFVRLRYTPYLLRRFF